MKERWNKIFFMVLIVLIFTGCGVKNTEREKDSSETIRKEAASGSVISGGAVSEGAVSEGVVSGGAVSDGAVSGRAVSGDVVSGSVVSEKDVEAAHIGQSFFENDDNWYDWQDGADEEYAALIQYRLNKKTKVREIKMEIDQVEWVSNNWLYYRVQDEQDSDVLWRIPIRKTKTGDRLQIKKKERVMEADVIWVSYATDSYLILEIGEEAGEETGIYKYDLKKKKKNRLMSNKGNLGFLDLTGHYIDDQKISWQQNYCFMIDGELIEESEDKLYRLNPETEKAAVIFSKPNEERIEYVFYQGEFYFENDSALYHYNRESKKAECLITKKKMMKAVGKLKSAEIKKLTLRDIVPYKDKFYLPFGVQWKKEDPDTGKEAVYERDELFYIKTGQPDKIFFEDKLMDYLDEDGEFGEYKIKKGIPYFSYSYEYQEFEGKMAVFEYMEYLEEEKDFEMSGIYVGYDIASKKGRELDDDEYEG